MSIEYHSNAVCLCISVFDENAFNGSIAKRIGNRMLSIHFAYVSVWIIALHALQAPNCAATLFNIESKITLQYKVGERVSVKWRCCNVTPNTPSFQNRRRWNVSNIHIVRISNRIRLIKFLFFFYFYYLLFSLLCTTTFYVLRSIWLSRFIYWRIPIRLVYKLLECTNWHKSVSTKANSIGSRKIVLFIFLFSDYSETITDTNLVFDYSHSNARLIVLFGMIADLSKKYVVFLYDGFDFCQIRLLSILKIEWNAFSLPIFFVLLLINRETECTAAIE